MSQITVSNSAKSPIAIVVAVAIAQGAAVLVKNGDGQHSLFKHVSLVDEAADEQITIGEDTYSREGEILTEDEAKEWIAKIAVATHLGYENEVFDYTVQPYKCYEHLLIVDAGSGEYAVGTDEEATAAAGEDIKQSLWAFKSSFLASFTDLPEEVFTALQDKCEGANPAITKLVERADGGLEEFINQAISADGRGHFLSGYDGNENEEEVEGVTYYIYRIN